MAKINTVKAPHKWCEKLGCNIEWRVVKPIENVCMLDADVSDIMWLTLMAYNQMSWRVVFFPNGLSCF